MQSVYDVPFAGWCAEYAHVTAQVLDLPALRLPLRCRRFDLFHRPLVICANKFVK